MDRLWAPWRMEYVSGGADRKDGRCFLCIEEGGDEDSLVVGRKGSAFVIMNRYPYSNGHVMVVPVRHVGSIEQLPDEEALDAIRLVKVMSSIFKEDFNAHGLNIGINSGRAAGAGLEDHFHIHMVPRWFGDTNYMTVTGEVRVISEHIMESCRRLKRRFVEKLL
jgi:ATP adenylyltransferase